MAVRAQWVHLSLIVPSRIRTRESLELSAKELCLAAPRRRNLGVNKNSRLSIVVLTVYDIWALWCEKVAILSIQPLGYLPADCIIKD